MFVVVSALLFPQKFVVNSLRVIGVVVTSALSLYSGESGGFYCLLDVKRALGQICHRCCFCRVDNSCRICQQKSQHFHCFPKRLAWAQKSIKENVSICNLGELQLQFSHFCLHNRNRFEIEKFWASSSIVFIQWLELRKFSTGKVAKVRRGGSWEMNSEKKISGKGQQISMMLWGALPKWKKTPQKQIIFNIEACSLKTELKVSWNFFATKSENPGLLCKF